MGKSSTYQLLPFANVQKTFGANGELIIRLFDEAPEEINLKEPVFVTIDGYPVPFFFKSFDPRGNNRALVVFDDMESQALAEELVGKLIEWKVAHEEGKANGNDGASIFNYTVIDEAAGELGLVSEFIDIPGNPCLQISNGTHEIMIPYREELITAINHKKKTITTQLPEGLIDLNRKA